MADQYIINQHGVMHSVPADHPLPAGARYATEPEIAAWQQADAQAKAQRLARVQADRARRAQLVVVGAPATEPETDADPNADPNEGKSKGKKDAAPSGGDKENAK